MSWILHVEKEISAAHHAGPPGHRCQTNHGHDFLIVIEISYSVLDEYGWGPDFAALKKILAPLDHNDLNEFFADPLRHAGWMPPTSENLSEWLYEEVKDYLEQGGNKWEAVVDFVRVQEGAGNHVTYRPPSPF